MAKVERLMQLVSLIRNRQVVSVRDMADACEVSQRTIYRYLNTLSRLDMPSYPSDIGGTASGTGGITKGCDIDDKEIVAYCLGHNPLMKYPFFVERLGRIRQKIDEEQRGQPGDSRVSFFQAELAAEEGGNTRESDNLERFSRARVNSQLVVIKTADALSERRVFRPRAIKIDSHGVGLVVSEAASERTEVVSLAEVLELDVTMDRLPGDKPILTAERESLEKTV